MPAAVKLIGFLLIGVFSINVFLVAWLGRAARGRDPNTIYAHRNCVRFLLALTVAMVLIIEGFVQVLGRIEYPWYFWRIHLPADILYVVLTIAVLWRFDGERRRDAHRFFVYPILVDSVVIAITGGILFYNA